MLPVNPSIPVADQRDCLGSVSEINGAEKPPSLLSGIWKQLCSGSFWLYWAGLPVWSSSSFYFFFHCSLKLKSSAPWSWRLRNCGPSVRARLDICIICTRVQCSAENLMDRPSFPFSLKAAVCFIGRGADAQLSILDKFTVRPEPR